MYRRAASLTTPDSNLAWSMDVIGGRRAPLRRLPGGMPPPPPSPDGAPYRHFEGTGLAMPRRAFGDTADSREPGRFSERYRAPSAW